MANTSLAQQLKYLTAPHTKLLTEKKKKPSLLFDPSEAASIDRATFYEIGLSGLNELIEINEVFEEFRDSLFDETSKNFERTIESSEVNKKLDAVIKKFLYSLSPYYLLKPSQKVLEWLITRFYVQDYNIDDLICITLPYHGTKFFARLLQVFDLKNSNKKWQWLHPVQKKGIPLAKSALFNHSATDVAFLKMICDVTVEAVKLYGPNSSKLSTLLGFYSTTVVGAIQHMPKITEFYLTDMLPSIFFGLGSDCVDFTASVFVIIASILAKTSFNERTHRKFVEKITKVRHASLHNSVILLLNILYQSHDENQTNISSNAVKNIIKNDDWFVSSLSDFISSGIYPNVFYLLLVRDSLKLLLRTDTEKEKIRNFIHALLSSCRVDDVCAEKLIKLIINGVKNDADDWSCELVQGLERQYPTAWDNVISVLFQERSSESLSHVLGLTSVTSQVQMFEKLNHVNSVVRVEALKYISENLSSIKIGYLKKSLIARWNDEDPKVIETMFLLPKENRFCSSEVIDRLLLKCWQKSDDKWNTLLLRIVEELDTEFDLKNNATKYTILLFPFWISSPAEVQKRVSDMDLSFFKSIKKLKLSFTILMKKAVLPSVEDLMTVYEELPKENVNLVTFLLFFSSRYASTKEENKSKILSFTTEEILGSNFQKLKWRQSDTWDDVYIEEYYSRTKRSKFPPEVIHKFFVSMIENTTIPEHFTSRAWWDFSDKFATLVSHLYKCINSCFCLDEETEYNFFITLFVEKHFKTLSDKITFLCNICIQHKADTSLQNCAFRMINSLLKNTDESYSWAMGLKSDNILVPSVLIFLYSNDSKLRSSVMETIEIITTSLSSALVSDLTYLDLLKHILTYKSEIILDREQLLSTMYSFLAQDRDIQSLLPVSIRCFTRTILESIINHVTDTTTPVSVSASLIVVLEFIRDTSSIVQLVEYADRIVKSSDSHDDNGSFVIQNVIDKLHAGNMEMYDNAVIRNFIEYCFENGSKIKIRTERGLCCVSASLLRKLAVDIFDKMDNELKKLILDSILKICSQGDNIDLISAANSFVKKVALNCELLISYLENMKNVTVEKKPKRTSNEVTPNILENTEWKCGVALMELIQNKKKIYNCHVIMPLLFEVLQKCCEIDDQMAIEYTKQVCLSCALNCSQKLISENRFDIEKLFNVELVVSCIRMSPNPQTHHHALLLLSHCATFAPNRVLHNIMAIFTFMGSSVLRQDDAFSFQIISNILETIVPLLVKNNDDSSELSNAAITSVLRVFASSIPDIPDHRRIPLLLKLIKILQDGDFLHVLVILSLECSAKCTVSNKAASAKYIEVVQELCLLLPVRVLLACFQKLMRLINALPCNIEEKQKKSTMYDDLIDLKKYTNKEFCHFNYITLNFISTILSNTKFINKVTFVEKDESKLFEHYFKGIIEQTLLYVKSVTDYSSNAKNAKNASTKYWKAIISQSLEILNKTNALLTNETFLSVVNDLLDHECLTVQRKTMEILNWRLQQIKEDETKERFSADELIPLIGHLMKVVDTISNNSDDDVFDLKLNQQTALISLKLITRNCQAFEHPAEFKAILLKLTNIMHDNIQMNDHVLACLVLCVAELISSLKIHAVESLPKFMPVFLQLFKKFQDNALAQSDIILLSIITALQKIIEIIPNFLSPYLETILFEVCRLSEKLGRAEVSKQKKNEDVKQSNILHKLKSIRLKISSEIPSRVLLPATSSCFTKFCGDSNFTAVEYLMNILAESFPNNGEVSVDLISLFISVLDFRCTSGQSENIITQVEDYVIDSLCKIVLKCSESTFRPFYLKLSEWGINTLKDISKTNRVITYYKILSKVSEKLKSIFVLFASNFIRNAADLLNKNNVSKFEGDEGNLYFPNDIEKTISLVDSILITLHNVFKYDTIKFLTKDRFNLLIVPLVDQIENVIGDYDKRSEKIIIPCLSHFATATTDDFLWKQFSYSVLLKTRHVSPEVRLTALEIICMFATQLGDNFLPFLPETVPFIAELLEDENEIVEKRTHKVVQKLEQVLDEPIQKYF